MEKKNVQRKTLKDLKTQPPPFPSYLAGIVGVISLVIVGGFIFILFPSGLNNNPVEDFNTFKKQIRKIKTIQQIEKSKGAVDKNFNGYPEYLSFKQLPTPEGFKKKESFFEIGNYRLIPLIPEDIEQREKYWYAFGWKKGSNSHLFYYHSSDGFQITFRPVEFKDTDIDKLGKIFKHINDKEIYIWALEPGKRTQEDISFFYKNVIPAIVVLPLIILFIVFKIYRDRKFKQELEKAKSEKRLNRTDD